VPVARKRCEIETKSLQTTNRKLHMGHTKVPFSRPRAIPKSGFKVIVPFDVEYNDFSHTGKWEADAHTVGGSHISCYIADGCAA